MQSFYTQTQTFEPHNMLVVISFVMKSKTVNILLELTNTTLKLNMCINTEIASVLHNKYAYLNLLKKNSKSSILNQIYP